MSESNLLFCDNATINKLQKLSYSCRIQPATRRRQQELMRRYRSQTRRLPSCHFCPHRRFRRVRHTNERQLHKLLNSDSSCKLRHPNWLPLSLNVTLSTISVDCYVTPMVAAADVVVVRFSSDSPLLSHIALLNGPRTFPSLA